MACPVTLPAAISKHKARVTRERIMVMVSGSVKQLVVGAVVDFCSSGCLPSQVERLWKVRAETKVVLSRCY